MSWFKRTKSGVQSEKKKEIPGGLWSKCPSCGEILYQPELERSYSVCTKCSHHFRIRPQMFLKYVVDEDSFREKDAKLVGVDFLNFHDKVSYADRLKAVQKKSGAKESIISGDATIHGQPVSLCIMDFAFIGGSMGSVVGEKISRAIKRAGERKVPLIIVGQTGGARMMEGTTSLMQMGKTAAQLARFGQQGGLFISILLDPCTAGVLASYAMLGDVIIAEPGALVGFAGPRVIKQTIGEDLPPGFQRSEFVQDHGFIDMIVPRTEMRERLKDVIGFIAGPPGRPAGDAEAGHEITDAAYFTNE